ncbi:DUF4352 domain-containing protein [Streptomyces sp. TRM68416]|uniref:DUF4352 domain-containing protein n=1 Tax=Streptomyces sp. TRM68416 TaxID=2758412 RepID=UPI0016619A42|nr:DUF4352 domain-containing protein [Streptomyces sp. TRM68416]MBD0837528.1 DUF4352 domain-containing protein [Streptomyces sp. TRM68416]
MDSRTPSGPPQGPLRPQGHNSPQAARSRRSALTHAGAALLGLSVGVLIGLAGNPNSDKTTPSSTVTTTQTLGVPANSETAPDADAGVLKMGATKTLVEAGKSAQTTVQALGYEQPYAGPQPQTPEAFQGGDMWATADVKTCNVEGPGLVVSQFQWSLAYEDGTLIEVTGLSGGDMPKPEYPMDKTLKPERCARGVIAFPVPGDKRPERLVYELESGEVVEWAVPKA